MVENLIEKVERTSVQVVDKSRRNFLKYLAGGLVGTAVVSGLGYLGYEKFREPNLRERLERTYPEKSERIFMEGIYTNPKEAREILLESKINRERYKNFDFDSVDKNKIIFIENVYKNDGFEIDIPEDPKKFSESDKLVIFYVDEANRTVAESLYPTFKFIFEMD